MSGAIAQLALTMRPNASGSAMITQRVSTDSLPQGSDRPEEIASKSQGTMLSFALVFGHVHQVFQGFQTLAHTARNGHSADTHLIGDFLLG